MDSYMYTLYEQKHMALYINLIKYNLIFRKQFITADSIRSDSEPNLSINSYAPARPNTITRKTNLEVCIALK